MMADCWVGHDVEDVFVFCFIVGGLIFSNAVQQMRIVNLRSSEGISPIAQLLSCVSSFSILTNACVLSFPYIACCSSVTPLQCLLNLMGIIQLIVHWLCTIVTMYLYLKYFPEAKKYRVVLHNDNGTMTTSFEPTPDWERSLFVSLAVKSHAAFLVFVSLAIGISAGIPSRTAFVWASIVGASALVVSLLQFLPQIYMTWKLRAIGALSIPSMAMQTPGSFVFCYSLARSPGTNPSTWITYLVGGCLQGTLLILCLYFDWISPPVQGYVVVAEDTSSSNNVEDARVEGTTVHAELLTAESKHTKINV